MGVVKAFARHLDALIGPGVMLIYPLYASIRAIETPSSLDDQQWLTYWVLYSLITLFELSCQTVLQWFPLWPYMKLVVCLWLVLPAFNGAAYIYENYVRKYVKIGTNVSPSYPEERRKVLQLMGLDARKSVERYIEKYGPDAFDRVVKAAEREAKKTLNNGAWWNDDSFYSYEQTSFIDWLAFEDTVNKLNCNVSQLKSVY